MFTPHRMAQCLLVVAASIVLAAGRTDWSNTEQPPQKPAPETAQLVRAQAASRAAEDQLDAAKRSAPAGNNPWQSTAQSRGVMLQKAAASQAFDQAKATEQTAVEKEAEADANKPPEEVAKTTTEKVQEEVQPYANKRVYRSAPQIVNIISPEKLSGQSSGAPDSKPPSVESAESGADAAKAKAAGFSQEIAAASEFDSSATPKAPDLAKSEERKAQDFNRELTAAAEAEQQMNGGEEPGNAGGGGTNSNSPSESLSFLSGYDKTRRELKYKQQKQLAMQASVQRAIHLKAEAIADEKRSVLQAAQEKVKYENARVSQAEQSLHDAKQAQESQELPPKTAAELVIEQEGDLKKATGADHAAKLKEKSIQIEENRNQNNNKKVKTDLQTKKALNDKAAAAYDKHLAMEYVRHEFERRNKHKTTVKLKMAEKDRKTSRTQEIMLKKSAAKESQGKALENRQKGAAQARLREGVEELKSDCKVSEWSHFGSCSKPCGGGMTISTRKIVKMSVRKEDCPGLARGKPCNLHECILNHHEQLMGEAGAQTDCGSQISKCRKSKVLLSRCRSGLANSMPTQMKASQDPHDHQAETVQQISAEEWRPSSLEQSEIRSAVARASNNVNPGRRMLTKQADANCLPQWHAAHGLCKAVKQCSQASKQQLVAADFEDPDSDSDTNSFFRNQKRQSYASNQEFDATLSHLVAGIHD